MNSPHVFLTETFLKNQSAQRLAQRAAEPATAMIEKLESLGISFATVDRSYPFMKKSIYFDASHRAKTKPHLAPGTNIIGIFVESLSSWFVDSPALERAGVTPNLRKIYADHYRFTNMQSATRPTMKGLIASLGSFLLPRADQNLLEQESLQGASIHFSLLPELLKKARGYHTVFINGARCEFGTMERLFRSNGYDEYFCASRSPMRDNARRPMSVMGMHDEDTFAFARRYLEMYHGTAPLFLSISTVQTHFPFDAVESDSPFSNPILTAVHATDLALGAFWSFLTESSYNENSLVLLTADHSIFPSPAYKELRRSLGEPLDESRRDLIPFALHFPKRMNWPQSSNNVLCSNLDIAPTVLDIFDLDLPNSFLGLSLFSEREHYPKLLSNDFDPDPAIAAFNSDEHMAWMEYLFRLACADRIWPR